MYCLASLSPEQQRFAKAFRAMKLSSTLFGVAVVQIKPQLEKLMNLPYGSLTKEMSLTQRLIDLFIKYQVGMGEMGWGDLGGEPVKSDVFLDTQ